MTKKPLCLSLVFFFVASLFLTHQSSAQVQSIKGCGSSLLFNENNAVQRQLLDEELYTRSMNRSVEDSTQYAIPLVFHIVHQNGSENISDVDVFAAVDLLNKAFANEIPFDPAQGVNVYMNFCLATTAITRHESPLTNIVLETQDAALKQIGGWDRTKYVNIWVVKSISSITNGPTVAGYATMPFSHGDEYDGIVVEADFINNNPDDVKVLVHEMGHYFGLYHTFEGGCKNDNCMMDGDRVCDTPPDNSTVGSLCLITVNTCHSDEDDPSVNNPFRSVVLGGLGDQPDMFQNYMDYGFQMCQNRFTLGQRHRMRDALLSIRYSLIENPGLCTACNNPILTTLNIPDTLEAGIPHTISVTANQSGLTYFWITSGLISNADTASVMQAQAGTLPLMLIVSNPASPSCSVILYDTLVFACTVPIPHITVNPVGMYSPGETVTFSTPDNGFEYKWFVDGVQVGTGAQIQYTINGSYGRLLTVSAGNGTCSSVSDGYYINPNNCGDNKQNNVWHFGTGVGVDFNTNPPTAIAGTVSTAEGCAILCDQNGVPVYSSNGVTVKNAQTNLVLTNGFDLSGHTSTTQSALFVPMPGNPDLVYLFTLDYQAGVFSPSLWDGGMYYSIINRQTDAVTVKNVLMANSMVEKMTAVRNTTGNGVWIIGHKWDSNQFYAWLLTGTGISSPVISSVGSVHFGNEPFYTIGEMKASPSGKKLALTINGNSRTEIFDFNTTTGKVTNPISMTNSLIIKSYGVAFSPNERFLYVSQEGASAKVIRYDLQAGGQSQIAQSETVVGTCVNGGGLQLAPNGKIYGVRSGKQYLSVISNPNAANPADCGFVCDGFKLIQDNSSLALPNPVQSIFENLRPSIVGPDKICLGSNPQTAEYTFYPTLNATYTWNYFGNNTSSVVNDSTLAITYNQAGTDTLVLKRSTFCGDSYDTLYIHAAPSPGNFSLGNDTTVCAGTTLSFDAGPGMFDYKWSNGATTQSTSIQISGTVWAQAITHSGCILSDTFMVNHYTLPALNLGADTSLCGAQTVTLSAPAGMDSYSWNTGQNTQTISAGQGSYTVTVGKYGCVFKDSIHIVGNIPSNIFTNDTVKACILSGTSFSALGGFTNYQWTRPSGTVENNQTILLQEAGWYTLHYSNACGAANDSLYYHVPQFVDFDSLITCADTARIIASVSFMGVITTTPGNFYIDNFIQHGDTLDIYHSGTYLLHGPYPGFACQVSQLITVWVDTALVQPPLSIDLGNDTSYCQGNILPLDAGAGFDSYHWNTGSHDASTTAYGFGAYYVSARYCGFEYSDTIHISQDNSLTVDLGSSAAICPGGSVMLDAGSGYDWYIWNTGDQTQELSATSAGDYSVTVGLNYCTASDTVHVSEISTNYNITGDTLICEGETLSLTATYYPNSAYLWDSLGTEILSGNVLHIHSPGIYRVKNADCPTSSWSSPFVVTAENLIPPTFTFSPDSICEGDPVSIGFDASNYEGFQWQDGSVQNPRIVVAPASAVLVLNGLKCSESYQVITPLSSEAFCYASINESADCAKAFRLHPNPSRSMVSLSTFCETDGFIHVSVSDFGTRNLGQTQGNLADVNAFLNRLLQQLPAGTYVIQLSTEKGTSNLKWVIAN